jgi:hypothetical protein
VFSARLDAAGKFAEKQPLKPGISPVVVPLSVTTGGTISVPSVTFSAGDASAGFTFKGQSTGAVTISASTPANFAPPTDGSDHLTATVVQSGLVPDSVTVGNNLAATAKVALNGLSPSGLQMTISVDAASLGKFKLSATPTGAGADTITVTLPLNAHQSPDFFVYGAASSGSGTYTAVATGFGSAQGSVMLAPSGVVFATQLGAQVIPIITTPAAAPSTINVFSGILDGNNNLSTAQPIRGDVASVTANITNANPSVGTAPSTVSITGGNATATIQFQPNPNVPSGSGNTTLTLGVPAAPAGFTKPSSAFITQPISVQTPGIACSANGFTIGQDLQIQNTCFLGQPAPSGGLTMTVSGSGSLRVAANATDAGAISVAIPLTAGQSTFTYYLQSLGSTGTVSYLVQAPGYQDGTGTVTFTPSGLVLARGDGSDLSFVSVPHGSTVPIRVYAAQLNPDDSFSQVQQVRGGLTVSGIVLTSNAAGTATVDSPVTLVGGADLSAPVTTLIHGVASGAALITVTQTGNFVVSTQNPFSPSSVMQVSVN